MLLHVCLVHATRHKGPALEVLSAGTVYRNAGIFDRSASDPEQANELLQKTKASANR